MPPIERRRRLAEFIETLGATPEGHEKRGQLEALRKHGANDDAIAAKLGEWAETQDKIEGLTGTIKVLKKNAEKCLEDAIALRRTGEDLGDLFTLAEREKAFLDAREALQESDPKVYALVFDDFGKSEGKLLAAIKRADAKTLSHAHVFAKDWHPLGHIPERRLDELGRAISARNMQKADVQDIQDAAASNDGVKEATRDLVEGLKKDGMTMTLKTGGKTVTVGAAAG